MSPLPPKVTAGEVVLCCDGHEVGRVLEVLSLAQSITAGAFALTPGAAAGSDPGRTVCASCRNPVAKVLRDGRRSLRLRRGWVS